MLRVFLALLFLSIQVSSAARVKKRAVIHHHSHAQSSVVIRASDGKILYGSNAHLPIVPASITKVMTLYLLFEAMDQGRFSMSSRLKVTRCASNQPPSKLGLKPGHTITVQDAIYGLVVNSANDVACVVAEALAGSEMAFREEMNAKARSLGMYHTTFFNASGLPNKQQRSTAYDLAVLSRAIWKAFPHYYKFFSTPRWNGHRNHNRLLGRYPGLDGLKTGYTNAGYNLAASATRNNVRLFAVVIGHRTSVDRNVSMEKLLNKVFAHQSSGAPLDDSFSFVQSQQTTPPMPTPVPSSLTPPAQGQLTRSSPFSIPMTAFIDPESVQPTPTKLPPPMPEPEEVTSIDPKKRWSVQVGAYQTVGRAKEVGDVAQLAAKKYLDGLTPDFSPIQTPNGTLHRCRFNKLEHVNARSCCQILRQKGLPCLVVAHY